MICQWSVVFNKVKHIIVLIESCANANLGKYLTIQGINCIDHLTIAI